LINSTIREFESVIKDTLLDESLQNVVDKSDILVICNSSTIVNFSSKNVKYFEWHFVIDVQEVLQLHLTASEFLLHEGVLNIPSNSSELSSVLDNSMEEGETEQQFFVLLWLVAVIKLFIVED